MIENTSLVPRILLGVFHHVKEKHNKSKVTLDDSFTISSVQLLSHVRLCDPMDCSMPGLPVLHQLLEFTQTHVHRVSDAIQPSHLLSSPSPPAFNLAQHQGRVFSNESVLPPGGQSIGASASVFAMNIQD